jgi:hypothetical protein
VRHRKVVNAWPDSVAAGAFIYPRSAGQPHHARSKSLPNAGRLRADTAATVEIAPLDGSRLQCLKRR